MPISDVQVPVDVPPVPIAQPADAQAAHPVPEPVTVLLVGSGLAVASVVSRCRRKNIAAQ